MPAARTADMLGQYGLIRRSSYPSLMAVDDEICRLADLSQHAQVSDSSGKDLSAFSPPAQKSWIVVRTFVDSNLFASIRPYFGVNYVHVCSRDR